MAFKFKVNSNTTLEDVEKELKRLYNLNVVEIPFNHVVRIAEFIGCTLEKPHQVRWSDLVTRYMMGLGIILEFMLHIQKKNLLDEMIIKIFYIGH